MSAGRILVVDDNVMNLKLTRLLLETSAYEVLEAMNAEEAQAILARTIPGLVLMDVQLPGTDGLTLTRALRQDPRLEGLVIVAMSAYAMRGDAEKAFAAGCDGYITKPVNTRTFCSVVDGYLHLRDKPRT